MSRLFGTDGIRGVVNSEPMTVDTVLKIGKAIAHVFRSRSKKSRFLIGKDTRLSGYMFETALSAGICSMGADVLLVGPLPTPGVAFVTTDLRADAGSVISASHNLYQDNGIKFFAPDGFKLPDRLEEQIESLVLSSEINKVNSRSINTGKAYRVADAIGRYMVFLKNVIPKGITFDGIKVVLDCANGAAYKIAPALLEDLGCKVVSINTKPTGKNINHNCGAMYPQEMASAVKRVGADVGFSLDGDGDRLIASDEKGNVLDGDHLIYIFAKYMKKKKELNSNMVVSTHMSNFGLEQVLSELGIKFLRTSVGDRYVVEEMKKNNLNLGGEQSGHIVFLNHHTTGDGLITALKLLLILKDTATPLSLLTKGIHIYPQILKNISVPEKKEISEMPALVKEINSVKKNLGNAGRIFVRYSGTENILRIMIEGRDERTIKKYAGSIASIAREKIGAT